MSAINTNFPQISLDEGNIKYEWVDKTAKMLEKLWKMSKFCVFVKWH